GVPRGGGRKRLRGPRGAGLGQPIGEVIRGGPAADERDGQGRGPPAGFPALGGTVGDREPQPRRFARRRVFVLAGPVARLCGRGRDPGYFGRGSHAAHRRLGVTRVPMSRNRMTAVGSALTTSPRALGRTSCPSAFAASHMPGGNSLDIRKSSLKYF